MVSSPPAPLLVGATGLPQAAPAVLYVLLLSEDFVQSFWPQTFGHWRRSRGACRLVVFEQGTVHDGFLRRYAS